MHVAALSEAKTRNANGSFVPGIAGRTMVLQVHEVMAIVNYGEHKYHSQGGGEM
jgi:hypothetical protein